MSFTFVTALYDIHRETHDHRTFSMYQEWFSKTLTIPFPMVIYTEEKNRTLIESVRANLPTQTIYTTIYETPFYYTTSTVKHIIEHTAFRSSIKHPDGLENRCYEYIPIVNSKSKWLCDAIEHNYFNTDMFFWFDAGLSRFITFDIASPTYNTFLINELHTTNKLYFQIGKKHDLLRILHDVTLMNEYIGSNTNFIMGCFFGGNKQILYDFCKKASELYITEYILKERVDNEQCLFGFLLSLYKDNLYLINNVPTIECILYYIFCNK
jgi:hypothetical protein